MNISSLIFDGVNGQSAVLNTDTVPIHLFETHVETRREVRPKVAGHGAWGTKTWMDVRTFHFEGEITTDSPANYVAQRMTIMGAFTPAPELGYTYCGTLRMFIDGITEELSVQCDLDGEPGMPVVGGFPSSSDLVLDLVANDPFMYGSTANVFVTGTPTGGSGGLTFPFTFPFTFTGTGTGGDIQVTNNGNTSAYPIVTFYGPCINPSISIVINGVTQTVYLSDTILGVNDTVTLDFRNRTAITNSGGSVYHKTQGSTWWSVPRGTWPVVFSATDASSPAHASISLKNAYNI